MLCESKQRIGFLGACFFIGVLFASSVIPVGYISDKVGRKWVYFTTLCVLVIACIGFIMATTLEQLYVSMFLLGTTFPGTIIVGTNYAIEFQIPKWKKSVLPINNFAQGFTLILSAFYFQQVSKKAIYLEIGNLIFIIYLLVQVTYLYPESPKFNYSNENFEQAKADLRHVAEVNGVQNYNEDKFMFDTEF